MKIIINIECETISEFYSHLTELRRQIKKECRRLKLDPLRDEFPPDVNLYDENCYGEHTVTIAPDGTDVTRHEQIDPVKLLEWVSGEGFVQYDSKERWIKPTDSNRVYTTDEVVRLFLDDTEPAYMQPTDFAPYTGCTQIAHYSATGKLLWKTPVEKPNREPNAQDDEPCK